MANFPLTIGSGEIAVRLPVWNRVPPTFRSAFGHPQECRLR